jgi:virginiamycin B lyase
MRKRSLLTAFRCLVLMVTLSGVGAMITPRTSSAAAHGDVTEYGIPTPNSGAGGGMALGPDGNVWFTEQNTSTIASITPDGTITEYVTPTANSGPTGLSFDEDGNLWFTEQFVNQMGMRAPDGTFTEYSLSPAPGAAPPRQPVSPRRASDGNVWYTARVPSTGWDIIGRLNPTTAEVTEFPIPTFRSDPRSIRNGPDGNLYFTEGNGNKIGLITLAGEITEFVIPTANSRPRQLEFDRTGDLWFTEAAGNNIGRMTLAGEFTEYPLPTANSSPLGITADISGNHMWFTEANTNRVARIDRQGHIKEVDVPTPNSFPQSLRAGADGRIYFVERNANKIGRVNLE